MSVVGPPGRDELAALGTAELLRRQTVALDVAGGALETAAEVVRAERGTLLLPGGEHARTRAREGLQNALAQVERLEGAGAASGQGPMGEQVDALLREARDRLVASLGALAAG